MPVTSARSVVNKQHDARGESMGTRLIHVYMCICILYMPPRVHIITYTRAGCSHGEAEASAGGDRGFYSGLQGQAEKCVSACVW